jgi:hypothetical protein
MTKFATLFHRPYDGFRCEPSPVRGVGGKDWNRRLGDEAGVNEHPVPCGNLRAFVRAPRHNRTVRKDVMPVGGGSDAGAEFYL